MPKVQGFLDVWTKNFDIRLEIIKQELYGKE